MTKVATCGLREAYCECREQAGHDGPHACLCGGSWRFDAEGHFEIVSIPGSDPDWEIPGPEAVEA